MAANGSIVISTELDNKKVEQQLKKLKRDIEKMKQSIAEDRAAKSPLVEQAEELQGRIRAAREEAARYKLEWLAGTAGADRGETLAIERANQLAAEYAKVEAQIDKIDQKLWPAYSKLDGMKEAAGGLEKELAAAGAESSRMGEAIEQAGKHLKNEVAAAGKESDMMGAAIESAGKRLDRLKNRLMSVVSSALIFTVITQALAKFRDWMGKVIASNNEASAAMARLKGALLTMMQPLVGVIVPAFVTLVNVLTRVVAAIANVVSMLFGTTAAQSSKAAAALHKETAAIKDTGHAAKKASGQLAAFDEINKLGDLSADNRAGGGAGGTDIEPDFSLFDTEEYKNKIDEITAYVSGALLALGAILAFSGANIPLGLGLMAVGAIGLASVISANWNSMSDGLREAITRVLLVLATAGLAIGAILAFSGANIPLGIGLMIAGAAALGAAAALNWTHMGNQMQEVISGILTVIGVSLLALGAVFAFSGANIPLGIGMMLAGAAALAGAVALNWGKINGDMSGVLSDLLLMVGGALLAIGAIFAFSGANLPLGIGLMAAGAAGLGAAAALNWGAIVTALQGPIGQVIAVASSALLALGVILAMSGVALPLGIALIAAGAAGLATVVALNWDSIVTALKGPVGKTIALASGALLALGIILAMSGVGLPLGIALIAAGAAGLVTVSALNWDAILDKLKGVWSAITAWWSASVAPKFTIQYWKGVFGSIKDGLVSKIKDAVNGGIALFNRFIDWINDKLNISWGSFSLFGKEIIPKGSFQLLTLPHIPMLAQGAVIPPNREFMAVLGDQKSGTNIETPEALLRQIMQEENGSREVVAELREILSAIREGKVMMVSEQVLATVVSRAMASRARATGTAVVPV